MATPVAGVRFSAGSTVLPPLPTARVATPAAAAAAPAATDATAPATPAAPFRWRKTVAKAAPRAKPADAAEAEAEGLSPTQDAKAPARSSAEDVVDESVSDASNRFVAKHRALTLNGEMLLQLLRPRFDRNVPCGFRTARRLVGDQFDACLENIRRNRLVLIEEYDPYSGPVPPRGPARRRRRAKWRMDDSIVWAPRKLRIRDFYEWRCRPKANGRARRVICRCRRLSEI